MIDYITLYTIVLVFLVNKCNKYRIKHKNKTNRYVMKQENLNGSHKIVYVTECLNVSEKNIKSKYYKKQKNVSINIKRFHFG